MADILPQTEVLRPALKLTDVYKKEGLVEFSQAMEKSNGKCLILVHPFFGLRTIGGGWDFDSKRWENIDDFIQNSKNLAQKSNLPAPLSNIPISMWDVIANLGVNRYQKEYKKLREGGKSITDLILKLKTAGLKSAIVGGCNFKGGNFIEGFSQKGKFSSFFASRDTLSEHYQRLEESGQKNPKWKHAFQKISPQGCVSGVIQTLSFCDVRFGMTNALYPQQMPKNSIIDVE